MSRWTKAAQEDARKQLREVLTPGDTVYTLLKHVSRSGTSRVIQVVKITCRGGREPDLRYLGYLVAKSLNWQYDERKEGVRVSGCGMDMGFGLAFTLAANLWPYGYQCTGEGCPSSDHGNGDRDYPPRLHRVTRYALRQRWL
jgi:hypothetical protein